MKFAKFLRLKWLSELMFLPSSFDLTGDFLNLSAEVKVIIFKVFFTWLKIFDFKVIFELTSNLLFVSLSLHLDEHDLVARKDEGFVEFGLSKTCMRKPF